MAIQSIEVHLPEDLLQQIDERARDLGGGRERLILEWIEKGIKGEQAPYSDMTFSELLARMSGPSPADAMTDAEVAEFAESEVRAYRAEKRSAPQHG